jgi:hypothetical protein
VAVLLGNALLMYMNINSSENRLESNANMRAIKFIFFFIDY